MRIIMKDRFMQIGTLEEAEFNRVVSQPRTRRLKIRSKTDMYVKFAGRNWNHGQVGLYTSRAVVIYSYHLSEH